MSIALASPLVMIPVVAILVAVGIALLLRPVPKRLRMRWLLMATAGAVLGGVFGLAIAWLVSDVINVFGVALTLTTRAWVACACALVGLAVARMLPVADAPRRPARFLAALALVPAVLAAALGINNDFAMFRTVGDLARALNPQPVPTLAPVASAASSDLDSWTPPADMPATGVVRQAAIPGATSGFEARPALVWLPPAAQVAQPPKLPLLIMLAGQPGAPDTYWAAGQLEAVANEFAAAHNGLAPVIVVPDQNGAESQNLICADSSQGKVDTYLSVDVLAWARANLPVQSTREATAVGGFSQGGTCTMELVLRHPDLFANALPIASELTPIADDAVVQSFFSGDRAAAQQYDPIWLMEHKRPFPPLAIRFGVGAADAVFSSFTAALHDAAAAAGIATSLYSSPGTSHDFNTVRNSFAAIAPGMFEAMGIPAAAAPTPSAP